MSVALVRQALEFVDPDESKGTSKRKRDRRSQSQGTVGQERVTGNKTEFKNNNKTKKKNSKKSSEGNQEVISKLLKLSKTTIDKAISEKIIRRTRSGKPLFDKIKVKKEVQKSILFPEDDAPKKKKKKNKKGN